MIIHKPEITEENGEICVSAQVEIQSTEYQFPDKLWFKFSDSTREFVTDRADGFAAALLPLAMTLGEDLEIHGLLSPRLLRGLKEYQLIQTTWNSYIFDKIEITPHLLQPMDNRDVGKGVACTFSGGVDSYHTLWARLPQNEQIPQYRLSHCLMINGFDLNTDLENTGGFLKLQQFYEPRLERLGLKLLISRTNIKQFVDAGILKQSFGAFLAGSALVLGRLFSVFYIASSYKFTDFFTDGSHPVIDNLICTETMDTVHDSPHLTRVEKTGVLARWEETYSALQVCSKKTSIDKERQSIVNCCRCEKCIRTILALDVVGALSKYTVFPKPLKRRHIRKLDYRYKGTLLFAKDIFNYSRIYKRNDIAFDVAWASLRSLSGRFTRVFLRKISKPFHKPYPKKNLAQRKMTPGRKRMWEKTRKNSRPQAHP